VKRNELGINTEHIKRSPPTELVDKQIRHSSENVIDFISTLTIKILIHGTCGKLAVQYWSN
jgi:hypothetical protein